MPCMLQVSHVGRLRTSYQTRWKKVFIYSSHQYDYNYYKNTLKYTDKICLDFNESRIR